MSIVTCRHCGESIQKSAEICPQCGKARPEAPPGPTPEPNLDPIGNVVVLEVAGSNTRK